MNTKWLLQRLWMLTATVAVIPLAAAYSADAQFAGDPFERHEVLLGEATEGQTVLSGFFLDRPVAELAVVSRGENGEGRVQLYAFDVGRDDGGSAWRQVLEATLGAEVLFVDVASIGGRDRLISYQSGSLHWFDPESATRHPLLEISTTYKSTHDHEGSSSQPGGTPPHVDVTRDLNHDGRDDLVVPDLDGFWISIQRGDGSFTDAVKLGPPEPYLDELVGKLHPGGGASGDPPTYGDLGITASTLPLYLSRVHEMDYDHDGRSDLVFWNQDHFEVHLQNEDGLFSPVADTFAPNVSFDSEGVYSRAFDFRGQGLFSILFGFGKKTHGTVLHSLGDLNGDGVADLVTLTLSGRGITRQRSVYEVHFGTAITDPPGRTVFAPEFATVIRPRGKGGAMQPWGYSVQRFVDLDGDGQLEGLFREVTVGLCGMARALVGNSVPINLEIFRMKDSAYLENPALWRKIRRFAPFAGLGNVFFPPVLLGDVNGDGFSDLLVGQSPRELQIFLGGPGPEPFTRRPHKVAVSLPADERNIRLTDLNKDGKQDVLVYRPSTRRAHGESNRVTMLIAR